MFWRAVGRWALIAIAVPLAAVAVRKISQRIESRRGSTRTSRMLTRAAAGMEALTGRNRGRQAVTR